MPNWFDLGTVTPRFDSWLEYPEEIISSELTRVTFNLNGIHTPQSYIRIKTYFPTVDGTFIATPRIYPADGPQLVALPIPAELRAGNWIMRNVFIRKFWRYRRFTGYRTDAGFSVQIEALL